MHGPTRALCSCGVPFWSSKHIQLTNLRWLPSMWPWVQPSPAILWGLPPFPVTWMHPQRWHVISKGQFGRFEGISRKGSQIRAAENYLPSSTYSTTPVSAGEARLCLCWPCTHHTRSHPVSGTGFWSGTCPPLPCINGSAEKTRALVKQTWKMLTVANLNMLIAAIHFQS